MKAKVKEELEDRFVMNDGSSDFTVPKQGLSEDLMNRIRSGGKPKQYTNFGLGAKTLSDRPVSPIEAANGAQIPDLSALPSMAQGASRIGQTYSANSPNTMPPQYVLGKGQLTIEPDRPQIEVLPGDLTIQPDPIQMEEMSVAPRSATEMLGGAPGEIGAKYGFPKNVMKMDQMEIGPVGQSNAPPPPSGDPGYIAGLLSSTKTPSEFNPTSPTPTPGVAPASKSSVSMTKKTTGSGRAGQGGAAKPPEVDPNAQVKADAAELYKAQLAANDLTVAAQADLVSKLEQNQLQQQKLHDEAAMKTQQYQDKIDAATQEMANISSKVDQGRWWASRDTGQKISSVIGLVLGALGSGNDGVNRAAAMIDSYINKDIELQKEEHDFLFKKGSAKLASLQNSYATARQFTQDNIQALQSARGMSMELAKNQINIAAAKTANPAAKLALSQLGAGLDKQINDAKLAAKQQGFNNYLATEKLKIDRMEAGAKMAAAGAKQPATGKQLSQENVQALADLPTAMKQLEGLGKTFNELKIADKSITSKLPDWVGRGLGTDVSKYDAEALLSMQAVGKIMEGGKLAAGDEIKYKNMLPKAGENQANATRKLKEAQEYLKTLVGNRVKALEDSGYDVSAFKPQESKSSGSGYSKEQAAAWISQNPNDKRVPALKQKFGLQ